MKTVEIDDVKSWLRVKQPDEVVWSHYPKEDITKTCMMARYCQENFEGGSAVGAYGMYAGTEPVGEIGPTVRRVVCKLDATESGETWTAGQVLALMDEMGV